jgi:hypothetical protein
VECRGEGEGQQGKAREMTEEFNKVSPVPTVRTRGTDTNVLILKWKYVLIHQ